MGQNIFSSKHERYKKMLMFIFNDADSDKRRKLLCLDNGLTISSRPTEKVYRKKLYKLFLLNRQKTGNNYLTRGKYC